MLAALVKLAGKVYERDDRVAGPITLYLGAVEEMGEVAEALLLTECKDFQVGRRKQIRLENGEQIFEGVAVEIGDVITYLLMLCHVLGIEPELKHLHIEKGKK